MCVLPARLALATYAGRFWPLIPCVPCYLIVGRVCPRGNDEVYPLVQCRKRRQMAALRSVHGWAELVPSSVRSSFKRSVVGLWFQRSRSEQRPRMGAPFPWGLFPQPGELGELVQVLGLGPSWRTVIPHWKEITSGGKKTHQHISSKSLQKESGQKPCYS